MVKKKKSVEEFHTSSGWKYEKVNHMINKMNDIFIKENVTFVEELVVLSWFNAQLIYNMGKHGTKDFLEESFPKQPQTKPSTAGIA